jgi:hypothetical protein
VVGLDEHKISIRQGVTHRAAAHLHHRHPSEFGILKPNISSATRCRATMVIAAASLSVSRGNARSLSTSAAASLRRRASALSAPACCSAAGNGTSTSGSLAGSPFNIDNGAREPVGGVKCFRSFDRARRRRDGVERRRAIDANNYAKSLGI